MKPVSRRDRIAAQLADLKMPGALEALADVLARVDGGAATAAEAIEELLAAQIALRNSRRLATAMRSSRLPSVKTLEEYDFAFQPSVKRKQIALLHELGFVARKENVLFLGPPGVGKRRTWRSAWPSRRRRAVGRPPQAAAEDADAPVAAGGRRDRLLAGEPERGDAVLPADRPALRARLDGGHVEQGVRGMGTDPGRRGDGGGAAGPTAAPVPHRQHPRQQLADATPCGRAGQGAGGSAVGRRFWRRREGIVTKRWGQGLATMNAVAAWTIMLALHAAGTPAPGAVGMTARDRAPGSVPSPRAGVGARPATHSWGPDSGRSAPYVRVPKSVQFSTAKSVQFSMAADTVAVATGSASTGVVPR